MASKFPRILYDNEFFQDPSHDVMKKFTRFGAVCSSFESLIMRPGREGAISTIEHAIEELEVLRDRMKLHYLFNPRGA